MNKTRGLLFTAILCIAATAHAQNTFTDPRDGKKYKTVKIGFQAIGFQTWMAENLNYNANGSKCYDNNSGNCAKYGRLYDWNTAMNACPSGWHLPSGTDWMVLVAMANVGGENVAGKKLKAKSGWNSNGNGTDEFGFSALPGGGGNSSGSFYNVGDDGNWWSATEYDASSAYVRYMVDWGDEVLQGNNSKPNFFSVRCINKENQNEILR
jgi:uncharacterized protein (TIGR02145 family)